MSQVFSAEVALVNRVRVHLVLDCFLVEVVFRVFHLKVDNVYDVSIVVAHCRSQVSLSKIRNRRTHFRRYPILLIQVKVEHFLKIPLVVRVKVGKLIEELTLR